VLDTAGGSEWNSLGPATLSSSGTLFGSALGSGSSCKTLVQQVGGGDVLCDTTGYGEAVRISPDGSLIASGTGIFAVAADLNTYIYKNGSLQAAVPQALPITWLDDNDLLVGAYVDGPQGEGTIATLNGTAICDASGNLVAPANTPCFGISLCLATVYVRSPNRIFIPAIGAVVSSPSGAILWQSSGGQGAIAGSEHLYPLITQLLAMPYNGP